MLRGVNVTRLITDDADLDVGGELCRQSREVLLDAFDHGHGVRIGLPHDFEDHGRHPIETGERARFHRAVLRAAEVREAQRRLGGVAHHELVEFILIL